VRIEICIRRGVTVFMSCIGMGGTPQQTRMTNKVL